MHLDIYGPYVRKDGRKHVVLKFDDNSGATVSYPKWLMEQHIGMMLEDDETVDHVNRDFTDDRIENLRIRERIQHVRDDVKRVKLIRVECVWCGRQFYRQPAQLRHNSKMGKAGPFCKKSCSGKYGTAVQNGVIKPLPAQPSPESQYYFLEK